MASGDCSSNRHSTFEVLRPESDLFRQFFPEIHAGYSSDQISESEAQNRAYKEFCNCIASVAGCSRAYSVARTPDFHHDVLMRFEERKLAERYDPHRGVSPKAYVIGVALMMIRERGRRRHTSAGLEDSGDPNATDVEHEASIREVYTVAASLMNRLSSAQKNAIQKKYSNACVVKEHESDALANEYVQRHRGLAKMRKWMAEMGISEF